MVDWREMGRVWQDALERVIGTKENSSSGSTPNKDTTDALVYPSKSTCLVKSLRGLKTCFYRVDWVEQKVDGCPSNAACLEEAWGGIVKVTVGCRHIR